MFFKKIQKLIILIFVIFCSITHNLFSDFYIEIPLNISAPSNKHLTIEEQQELTRDFTTQARRESSNFLRNVREDSRCQRLKDFQSKISSSIQNKTQNQIKQTSNDKNHNIKEIQNTNSYFINENFINKTDPIILRNKQNTLIEDENNKLKLQQQTLEKIHLQKKLEQEEYEKKSIPSKTACAIKEFFTGKKHQEYLSIIKMKKQFESANKSWLTSSYEKEAARIGLESLPNEDLFEDDKTLTHEEAASLNPNYDKDKKRSDAVYKFLTDKTTRTIEIKNYSLNTDALEYLPKLDFDPQNFKSLNGNMLQHYLHNETVGILNETANLLDANADHYQAQILSYLTFYLNDLATNYNNSKQIEKTFIANKTSKSIFEMSKKLLYFINNNKSEILFGAIEGLPYGAYDALNSTYELLKHPLDTLNAFKDITINLWELYRLSQYNPNEYDRKYHAFIESFEKQFEEFKNLAEENPRTGAKEASRFFTSFITGNKLPSANNALLKSLGKICNGLKIEEKILTTFNNPVLKSLSSPLHSIGNELKTIKELALKYGHQPIEYAKKCLDEYPLIHNIKNSTEPWLEFLAKHGDYWDGKSIIHICKGEILEIEKDGEKIFRLKSGMHTEEAFKEFKKVANLTDDVFKVEKLENGVTRVICPESAFTDQKLYENARIITNSGEKIQGIKTLWPSNYTPNDIAEAAKEIFSNPINNIGKNKFVGITSKNIKVEGYLNKCSKISTFYPTWHQ